MNAIEYLEQADITVKTEGLTDGSVAYNLHIGDREFPCYSRRHADEALRRIAAALHDASNGPRFDYLKSDPA